MSEGTVNQEGNIVAGHQGGRDVNVTNNYYPPISYQAMRRLVEKFEQEIKGDAKLQHFIEELERYYKEKDGDNLTLEEKLAGSAAKNSTDTALVAKESYSKLLTKYSLISRRRKSTSICLVERCSYSSMRLGQNFARESMSPHLPL